MRAAVLLGLFAVACASRLEGPVPEVTSTTPSLACNEQLVTEVALAGTGFAPLVERGLDDAPVAMLPKVTLVRTTDPDGAAASGEVSIPDAPAAAATGGLVWRSASELAFSITPDLAIQPGLYDVRVENPAGLAASLPGGLLVVPRPAIDALVPSAVCTEAGAEIRIEGDWFLSVGAQLPTVTVAGAPYEAVLEQCRQLAGAGEVSACRALVIEVPASALDAGPADVIVTNPAPAACASTEHARELEPLKLEVLPPPELTGVAPRKLCQGGGRLTLAGLHLREGSTVRVGDMEAQSVEFVDGSLDARFGAGLEVSGPHAVTVQTPEGCADTLSAQEADVFVVSGPQLFFVDPPVAYNGIALQLTAYGSGLSADVTVELVKGETRHALTATWDALKATRLKLDLPEGLEPGTWSLELSDATGCPATLADALTIVSTVNVPVARVEPAFGWTSESTGVTVFAAETIPDGHSGFLAIPRLYVTRSDDDGAAAAPVEAVTVIDGRTLTAVVPAGLAAGFYDLVLVNPDGSLGLLEDAFRVTANPPPKVAGLAPGSLPDSTTPVSFVVQGSDFRESVVSASCRSAAGVVTTPTVTTGAVTPTSVTATLATSGLAPAACVVRVTNTDEDSWVDFSSLVVTNPAQNLTTPEPGPSLTVARRALGLVSLRASGAAKYLYAVGGDDGTTVGVFDTVESNTVDVYGTQGAAWVVQRNRLSTKRAFAGTGVIGRYVYAVGGWDGVTALASVERAAILDPAFGPEIDDLDLQVRPAGEAGLGAGAWYYRVSAVMGADDPVNPDGETLASERFPILLPSLEPVRRFALTVHWSEVPGAVAYRVYRTPLANDAAGTERLLATVSADEPRRYTDTGAEVAAAEEENRPLPLGSLGRWHPVAAMASARQGAAVTVLADRDESDVWWIHAFGGRDETGAALSTIERLRVDVAAAHGAQTAGVWEVEAQALSQARWQTGAFVGTHATTSRIGDGEAVVWVGPGVSGSGAAVSAMDAWFLQADGSLGTRQTVSPPSSTSGYASILAGNFLYVFGGGSPTDTSVKQGEICAASVGGCQAQGPPRIRNWNQATSMSAPRWLSGYALEGATIYLVGGVGVSGTGASATTEQLIW